MKFKKISIVLFAMLSVNTAKAGNPACITDFVNPLTDICWSCMLPITIGSVPVSAGVLLDTVNPASPVQLCPMSVPPYIRPALAIGYWEPDTLIDVTKTPYCMVNLGFYMPMGINMQLVGGSTTSKTDSNHGRKSSFFNAHWYKYPLIYWLQLVESASCFSASEFNLAYMTELDPLWNNDNWSFILNPEALLFGNPVTQLACVADAVVTSANVAPAIDALFWCMGSQGSTYPLTGNVAYNDSISSNAVLIAERLNFKLHRQFMELDSLGIDLAVCHDWFLPIMPKSRYRYQFTRPLPEPYACHPYGTPTLGWDAGEDNPLSNQNFGFINWKKRNCAFL